MNAKIILWHSFISIKVQDLTLISQILCSQLINKAWTKNPTLYAPQLTCIPLPSTMITKSSLPQPKMTSSFIYFHAKSTYSNSDSSTPACESDRSTHLWLIYFIFRTESKGRNLFLFFFDITLLTVLHPSFGGSFISPLHAYTYLYQAHPFGYLEWLRQNPTGSLALPSKP